MNKLYLIHYQSVSVCSFQAMKQQVAATVALLKYTRWSLSSDTNTAKKDLTDCVACKELLLCHECSEMLVQFET